MNKSDITRDYCMLQGSLAKKDIKWIMIDDMHAESVGCEYGEYE